MQKKTITLNDPDLGDVTITICRADVRADIARGRKVAEAEKVEDKDPDLHTARTDVLPLLETCTIAVKGLEWPLTAERIMELPSEFVLSWRRAIWDLNPFLRPDWSPALEKKDEQPSSTPG
jgi:hypothetical protein